MGVSRRDAFKLGGWPPPARRVWPSRGVLGSAPHRRAFFRRPRCHGRTWPSSPRWASSRPRPRAMPTDSSTSTTSRPCPVAPASSPACRRRSWVMTVWYRPSGSTCSRVAASRSTMHNKLPPTHPTFGTPPNLDAPARLRVAAAVRRIRQRRHRTRPVKTYQYPNFQDARTLWYHDHGVHYTARTCTPGWPRSTTCTTDGEGAAPAGRVRRADSRCPT